MKILLSCIPFDGGKSGISVYVREVVKALAAQGHDLTLILEKEEVEKFPNFPKFVVPAWCRKPIFSILYHLFWLPFRIPFRQFDMVILCAANRRAFCRFPIFTVAVVHDLSQYHIPQKYDRFRMLYVQKLLPHYVRKAQAVVAISKSTAADLTVHWRIPPEKVHVIYNGLSLPQNATQPPCARDLQPPPRPYILYIARLEHPGKNHIRLIQAYDSLPDEITAQYDLLLPGAPWPDSEKIFQAAKAARNTKHIHLSGFVPQDTLPALYQNATCFLFPSLYEGFGLPLLEAMHYGVPCACSNTSSLAELGTGAALLFDPNDTRAIAKAIQTLLTSHETRESLRKAGYARAGEPHFRWENTATKLAALRKRPTVFGVPCDNVTIQEALERLDNLVQKRNGFVAFLNAHCLNVACKDNEYKHCLQQADAVWPDGSGLRIAGRIRGFRVPANVNGTDLFPCICQKTYRIFLLGGKPGVAQQALEKARAQFPNAYFVGAASGYFQNADEEQETIAQINALHPDLLLVGMGVPLQEKWISRHRNDLQVGAAMAVGGLLDFVSGRIPRAPKWLRRLGLEWCFRLLQEPRRLFKRYVLGNPLFVLRLLFRKD